MQKLDKCKAFLIVIFTESRVSVSRHFFFFFLNIKFLEKMQFIWLENRFSIKTGDNIILLTNGVKDRSDSIDLKT